MNAGIDGELVRKLRTVKSWSQEELGQISGLSARTVQRIETEGSGSLDSRRALASAFGLKPEDLLAAHADNAASTQAGEPAAYVDRPRLGAGIGAIMGMSMGVILIALVVVFAVMIYARGPVPGKLSGALAGVLAVCVFLFCFTIYWFWLTATTSYRLSADGIQVRYGPHLRIYRWDDFVTAHWQSFTPMRLTLQPITRFSDVLILEPRHGGRSLDLTPHDPSDFMRQIASLAPQLAQAGIH
jgi:transcriptional regulator with XRE-family HTH domain